MVPGSHIEITFPVCFKGLAITQPCFVMASLGAQELLWRRGGCRRLHSSSGLLLKQLEAELVELVIVFLTANIDARSVCWVSGEVLAVQPAVEDEDCVKVLSKEGQLHDVLKMRPPESHVLLLTGLCAEQKEVAVSLPPVLHAHCFLVGGTGEIQHDLRLC